MDLSVGILDMSFSWPPEGPTTGRAVFVCQLLVCFLLVGCLCCILSVFGFAFSICISSVRFLFFRYAVCLSGGSELRCLSFFVGRVVSVRESGVLGTTLSSPAQKEHQKLAPRPTKEKGEVAKCWLVGYMGSLGYMAHRAGGLVGLAEQYGRYLWLERWCLWDLWDFHRMQREQCFV